MMTDLQNRANPAALLWGNRRSKEMGKDSAEVMFHVERKRSKVLTWETLQGCQVIQALQWFFSFFVVVHRSVKHIYNLGQNSFAISLLPLQIGGYSKMCPCPSSCRNQAHWSLLLVMLGSFSGISGHTGDDMCQSSPYSNPPADRCITACPNMPKQHIASQHSGTTALFPELVLTDAAPNLLSRNIPKSQPSPSIYSK